MEESRASVNRNTGEIMLSDKYKPRYRVLYFNDIVSAICKYADLHHLPKKIILNYKQGYYIIYYRMFPYEQNFKR